MGSGGGSIITFPDDADDDSETLLVVTTVEQPYVMIKECLKLGNVLNELLLNTLTQPLKNPNLSPIFMT